ncbi:cadmium resistance transporter [Geminocystis sp. NIES-3708]|uniref:cadmium resistance transporter n=1 Tax=Geminocystis sp. NIES-3708 TaxID=1615909 RepID=UPI0005FC7285|nr:cadmium resistance transporter [Geminocystis sp. NIES-3708]BAQ59855.1 cadmium resistance transporter [Geminocystis sp. NIES-3708]
MDWLMTAIKIGLATGLATTFDDNIYLTGFFSKVNRTFRPKHVVVGELLGFTTLVCISLIGFLIGLVISPNWIGLLGFLPILIGFNNLRLILLSRDDSSKDISANLRKNAKFHGFDSRRLSLWEVLQDRKTYQISAVTISNGGNNLGIYIPLFASSSLESLIVIILCCYALVLVWLFMSYNLTRQPGIAVVLSRYAGKLFPFVLMWLGLRIILDNESYKLFLPYS